MSLRGRPSARIERAGGGVGAVEVGVTGGVGPVAVALLADSRVLSTRQ